ncbi:MAG: PTS sugar transporter subunit IIA [Alphaproteobacteria bacterium]|nr:PTS sugar transporter subunit IIA [Alphaproteobacteria bacterium]
MFDYGSDLYFDSILPCVGVSTARQILDIMAQEAVKNGFVAESLLPDHWRRESAARSGVGDGVAVAHLQIQGPLKAVKILATLKHDVDFGACDGAPVDLVCLVISPESDGPLHLRRLARISRFLKNDKLHRRLLEADDSDSIRSLLIDPEGWLLAAA